MARAGSSRTRVVAAALAAVALASPGMAAAADEPFGRLGVDEVERLVGKPDVRIIDVNSEEVWRQGHVPGALLGDLGELEKVLPADKTLRLVFYCKNTH